MWKLSGFADEIDEDFEEQCRYSAELGLAYIEFRSAWGTNVVDLDDEQVAKVRDVLGAHGLRVSSVASPVGKIAIGDDVAPELERLRRAIHVADVLGAPYIRIFSFYIPAGDDPAAHRDEVIRRMTALADIGEEAGVVLIHENEKGLYGDTPERCLDIIESVNSPYLAVAWDSANFVQVGVTPYDDGYVLLRPHLAYVQVKDAVSGTGQVVPAGRGDGQLPETVRALKDDGYDGFVSLEPHLGVSHHLGGFSGPALFGEAHRAFIDILEAEGVAYR